MPDVDEAARPQDTQDRLWRHALGDGVPVVPHEQLRLRASRAEPRDERQDLLEVDPDEPPGDRGAWSRDLEEQEASARLQDPSALPQSHFQIGHVAKSVSHAQEIEVIIAERQFLHSSLHQRD